MNKKYEGSLDRFKTNEIYINVNHLEKGSYNLKIVYKNKVIKSTHFKKK
tara:strand:- start:586 stop:732 length:147 start_codon:yes stop_codon:yes gene_type:complete